MRLHSLSHTLHIIAWQAGTTLLTPGSDEELNFPCNNNLISSRNVTRRKQNINQRILFDSLLYSPNEHYRLCTQQMYSRESYYQDEPKS